MRQLDCEGTFRAKAIHAVLDQANTGTWQAVIRFSILDEEYAGAEITAWLYCSEAALPRTVEALRYCGWEGDDLNDLSTVGSKDCELVIVEDEYNGKVRLKVKWVNELGSGGVRESRTPEDQRKAFAAKMRGSILALGAKNGGKSAPAPKSKAPAPVSELPPVDDSDIPF